MRVVRPLALPSMKTEKASPKKIAIDTDSTTKAVTARQSSPSSSRPSSRKVPKRTKKTSPKKHDDATSNVVCSASTSSLLNSSDDKKNPRNTKRSKKEPKSKNQSKPVPTTAGGLILDVNNSIVSEPQSMDGVNVDSYKNSPITANLPQQQNHHKKATKTRHEGIEQSPIKQNNSISQSQLEEKSSPTKRRHDMTSRVLHAGDSITTSTSTGFGGEGAPISTMQLRAWFQENGQHPTQYEQQIPAFPIKKKVLK